MAARCRARRSVAASSGKVDGPCERRSGARERSSGRRPCLASCSPGGGTPRHAVRREHAGDGRAPARRRIELDPAAMQLDEGAHDRQAEADAAMARAERCGSRSGRRRASIISGGMPRPSSATSKTTSPPLLRGRSRHGLAGAREADRVGQQIEQDLAHALAVRHEARRYRPARRSRAVQLDLREPVLHARASPHRWSSRMSTVLERRARSRRCRSVARSRMSLTIASSAAEERMMWPAYSRWRGLSGADGLVARSWREADDVGERRAQLVGDVVHEIVAQLRGALQRLVALGQRPLDVHARGHVDEGEERRAIRQRRGGAIDHRAVAALHAAGQAHARMSARPGDRAARSRPRARPRGALAAHARSWRRYADGRRAPPATAATSRAKARIVQLEPAIGAEHRDAFLQRVEGLALDARQRVELRSRAGCAR